MGIGHGWWLGIKRLGIGQHCSWLGSGWQKVKVGDLSGGGDMVGLSHSGAVVGVGQRNWHWAERLRWKG